MKMKKCLTLFITFALLLSSICITTSAATLLEDFTYEIFSGGITITEYTGQSTNVVISDTYTIGGVTYPVKSIGSYAFENSTITSVELPEGITAIAEGAFYNCDSLTKVIIPYSVANIDLYAFDDCNNLTDVVVLNSEVTIGDSAFGYYYSGRKYYIVDNFVLRGFENSTAQEYANTNDMTFEIYVKPVLGDVNKDKKLNLKDLVILKKLLAGNDALIDSADINGDGAYSAEDLVCIRILLLCGEENLKTHTVIFKDLDGNVLDTQKVLHYFAASAPEPPVIDNYIFTGWNADFKNVMSDMVITAQYVPNTEPMFTVEKINAKPGDNSVTVAISVKNNPGILGMTLTLEYNENIMSLTNASNGTALSGVLNFTKANILKSGCNFVWDGQEISFANIKDGTVLLLTFDISEKAVSGNYPINISYEYGDIIDGNLSPISFVIENGNVVIS